MKITIESTSRVVYLVTTVSEEPGFPCRVWEGQTDSGIPVTCLVSRIGVLKTDDQSQFDSELIEQREPSDATRAFPLRMIL
jgi:hypothetical protein